MKVNSEEFELILGKCFAELSEAQKDTYEPPRAEKTAAMFLSAQMMLANFIADIELKAKHSKNEIERIEASKYFDIKNTGFEGKKMTEATLTHSLAKENDVIEAKKLSAQAEAELRKFNYLMSSLKDGHLYFRALCKKNNWD